MDARASIAVAGPGNCTVGDNGEVATGCYPPGKVEGRATHDPAILVEYVCQVVSGEL